MTEVTCVTQMQAECMTKLQSSVKQLNIDVQPVLTCNSAAVVSPRLVMANGEFEFCTRHRKMIQKLTQRWRCCSRVYFTFGQITCLILILHI